MKKPDEVIILEDYLIKFYDETDYEFDPENNFKGYDRVYLSCDEKISMSLIGIEIYENDNLKASCLIGSRGFGTSLNGNTTLISYGGIVVCCSDTVFKLTIPNLDLEWKTVADLATCFGIHYLDEDYVVHGELEISRLDKYGNVVWKQSGRDIWTTPDGYETFLIDDNYIVATDWDYNKYKFDFNGNVIEEYKVKPQIKENKKWWRFW